MQILFVVCQHLEDAAFWRGDLDACARLQGVRDAEFDAVDFPLVALKGVANDVAVRVGQRSVVVKDILECHPTRFRSLDDLAAAHNQETPPVSKCVVHYAGERPAGMPVDEAKALLRSNDAWVVRHAADASWTLRQGRFVGKGCRDLIAKYSLKQRQYLGPTSLTSELTLLMANQCLARRGMLALDPYVGTGGGLVGVVHFGGIAVGAEIDWRMVQGAQGNRTFDQYALPRPDIVRGDFSAQGRVFWGSAGVFDAIVGDPPYGVRAGARKSGTKRKRDKDPPDPSQYALHIPPTQPYEGEQVMADLVTAARELLVPGGRLVFLFPVESDVWMARGAAALPAHDGFVLVNAAEQKLRGGLSRVLVTLEKALVV